MSCTMFSWVRRGNLSLGGGFVSCSGNIIHRIHGDSYYILMTNKHHWLKASTQCQVFGMTLAAAKDVTVTSSPMSAYFTK